MYPAHGAGMAPPTRDSGGYPAHARGRSRSPGRGGCRVHGVRVVERVELELAPDIEELYQRGRELHEAWRLAQEQVQWCEQIMVPIEHHERAKREAQLLNEQAAETIYRQQHERYIKLARSAEEERNRALQEGQRARQELESKTQELQRVYESAGAYVQQKDQTIERTLAEAYEWRRAAQEKDDIVQLLETRVADSQAYIQNLETPANSKHDAYRAPCEVRFDSGKHDLERATAQCADSQTRIDLMLRSEAIMERQNGQLREELRSGSYPASEAVAGTADRLLRSPKQVKDLEKQVQDLRQVEESQQRKSKSCRWHLLARVNSYARGAWETLRLLACARR